jgi:uncharacterized protein (UPF0333 family)
MTFLVVLLVVVTSLGIAGYLMQGYQMGSSNKESITIKLEANNKEMGRVTSRISDIESQISNLPSAIVKSRIELEKNYREEVTKLKSRYSELLQQESELKINLVEADGHLGPIVYVSKELGIEPAKAAIYLVALIVVIFDPLTIMLTISINHLNIKKENESRRQAVEVDEESQEREYHGEEKSYSPGPQRRDVPYNAGQVQEAADGYVGGIGGTGGPVSDGSGSGPKVPREIKEIIAVNGEQVIHGN